MGPPHRPPPEPLRTNDLPVIAAGMAIWAGALVVLLLQGISSADVPWRWVWACVAGLFLGAIGIRTVLRRNAARPRTAAQKGDIST